MRNLLRSGFIFLFIFGVGSSTYSQLQTAHWFFGSNAGLDFNSGVPVATTLGQLSTNEGSTSISDEYGGLLFYSDGEVVHDINHEVMPGGTGLLGSYTSSQSALVIPKLDNCDQFYLFTIDASLLSVPTAHGINYSVIDMTLNSGRGDIVPGSKNTPLPINGQQRGCEKLTAVVNANRDGYWLITHYLDNMYAFEITEAGINPDVVASPTIFSSQNGIGFVKPSPDGTRLAVSKNWGNGGLAIYDFDISTGLASNEIILYDNEPAPNSRTYYGVEFSPSGEILYANFYGYLAQYDLNAPSIADSEYVVEIGISEFAMQIALDGNIYFPGQGGIHRISNPDVVYDPIAGTGPVYEMNVVDLMGRSSMFGLPQFLNSYFRITPFINGSKNTGFYCAENTLEFSYCSQGGIVESISWDFGNGNSSTEESPEHIYSIPGIYTVTVTAVVDGEEFKRAITFEIVPKPVIQSIDVTPACYGASAELEVLTSVAHVYWSLSSSFVDTIHTGHHYTTAAIYDEPATLAVIASDGLCVSDPATVTVKSSPELFIHTKDTLICKGDSATLSFELEGGVPPYSYHWSIGSYDENVTVEPSSTTNYKVRVSDGCGHESQDEVKVYVSDVTARFSYKVTGVFDVAFTNHSFPQSSIESKWHFGDGRVSTEKNPWHRYDQMNEFISMLAVTDSYGCVDSSTIIIKPPAQVYIPSAFSPNGDGVNDHFKIVAENAQEIEVWIFDRWGKQVFFQKGKDVSWNGSSNGDSYYVPAGVYVYKVIVRLEPLDVLEYTGQVNVIR